MTSQVLYRKWRPQTFAEVVGQEAITRTLLNALALGRVSHAYLFCGPRGTGKTSTGRILAKAINCLKNGKGEPCNDCSICNAISQGNALDLIEIDAASNRGIDEIRSLREKAGFSPNEARYKVYIIDEVHMLTEPAFNALLKTLEEPPPHVIFILATTEAHKLPLTIISRCQRLDFRRLSRAAIQERLEQIRKGENIQADGAVLRLIADASAGSLRDAENLLEQLMVYYGSNIELQQAQELVGQLPYRQVAQLARFIFQRDAAGGIRLVHQLVNQGTEARQIQRSLLAYLRDLLLSITGGGENLDLDEESNKELSALARTVTPQQVMEAIKRFGEAEFRQDAYSTLPLELAFIAGVAEREASKAEPLPQHAYVPEPQPPVHSQKEDPTQPKAIFGQTQPVKPDPKPSNAPASQTLTPRTPLPASHPSRQEPSQPLRKAPIPSVDALARLTVNWRQLLRTPPKDMKMKNSIALLTGSCKPVAVEGDTIVLEFRWQFHKDNIENPENRHTVEELLSAYLGQPYKVRCILADKGSKEASSVQIPPQPKGGHLIKEVLKMGAVPLAPEEPPVAQGEEPEAE